MHLFYLERRSPMSVSLISLSVVCVFSCGVAAQIGQEVFDLGDKVVVFPGSRVRSEVIDPGQTSFASRSLDGPALIVDGWTGRAGELDDQPPATFVRENYLFTSPTRDGESVAFVLFVRVPRDGLPQTGLDLVLIPSIPRNGGMSSDLPPQPSRGSVLFVDDVAISPIPGASEVRFLYLVFSISGLEDMVGTGTFDWFAMIDFDARLQSDDDGDSLPDVAIERTPGIGINLKLSDSLGQFGADVLDFFTGNASRVNVFEPRGLVPAPRPTLPGMLPGEDETTRPWSFVIR